MDIITLELSAKKALAELGVKIKPAQTVLSVDISEEIMTIGQEILITPGQQYLVAFNGVSYNVVGKEVEGNQYIGNMKLIDMGEDTGENFLVMYMTGGGENNENITLVATIDGHNIKVSIPETIHPIDPKYLPGVCLPVVVDFDELGLTNAILSLLNNGGGDLNLHSVDGGAAVSEAMCNAIPLDRSYIAKLTVPGMGVMNVTPIYTLKDDYGFKVAHFDSYTESNNALTKFYVRLYRNTNTAAYSVGMVRVGFY